MITRGIVLDRLEEKPFQPFRIQVADGKSIEILDPQLVVVMESQLFVAFPKSNRFKFVSLQNISSIDGPIQAS
jgi:hypothetical protein